MYLLTVVYTAAHQSIWTPKLYLQIYVECLVKICVLVWLLMTVSPSAGYIDMPVGGDK